MSYSFTYSQIWRGEHITTNSVDEGDYYETLEALVTGLEGCEPDRVFDADGQDVTKAAAIEWLKQADLDIDDEGEMQPIPSWVSHHAPEYIEAILEDCREAVSLGSMSDQHSTYYRGIGI